MSDVIQVIENGVGRSIELPENATVADINAAFAAAGISARAIDPDDPEEKRLRALREREAKRGRLSRLRRRIERNSAAGKSDWSMTLAKVDWEMLHRALETYDAALSGDL